MATARWWWCQPASELLLGSLVHDDGKAAAARRVASRRRRSLPSLLGPRAGVNFQGDEIPASNCCANNVAQTQPRRRGDRQRARKRPITAPFSIPPRPSSLSLSPPSVSPSDLFFAASLRTTCGVGSSPAAEQTSNAPRSSRERGTLDQRGRKWRAAAAAAATRTTTTTAAAVMVVVASSMSTSVFWNPKHTSRLYHDRCLRGTSLASSPRRSLPFSHATCIRVSIVPPFSRFLLSYTHTHTQHRHTYERTHASYMPTLLFFLA